MPTLTDNELLDRYLSGAITAPEEAELERRAEQDPVLGEALAGLYGFAGTDHAGHVSNMMERAGTQVRGEGQGAKIRPLRRYAAAAAIVLLIAAVVFLLPTFNNGPEATAMRTEAAPEPAAAPIRQKQEPPVTTTAPQEEAIEAANDEALPSPAPSSPTPDPRPRPQVTPPPPPAPETVAAEEIVLPADDDAVAADAPTTRRATEPVRPLPEPEISELPTREVEGLASTTSGVTTDPVRKTNAPGVRNQGAFITGSITDDNGEPIPNVLVRLPGQPIGERTDTAGVFRLAADATASRLEFSHPDFKSESLDVNPKGDNIQLTLEVRDDRNEQYEQAWKPQIIPLGSGRPGYALPEEGFNALRRRIEDNRPDGLPAGKYKLSFIVNTDGTLEDFVFRGSPEQEVMDYIGETLVRTSIWNVVTGEEPVRVYFKVVFE